MTVSPIKMARPVEMPYVILNQVGP